MKSLTPSVLFKSMSVPQLEKLLADHDHVVVERSPSYDPVVFISATPPVGGIEPLDVGLTPFRIHHQDKITAVWGVDARYAIKHKKRVLFYMFRDPEFVPDPKLEAFRLEAEAEEAVIREPQQTDPLLLRVQRVAAEVAAINKEFDQRIQRQTEMLNQGAG